MDYRKKKYYALQHFGGAKSYWDEPFNNVFYFKDLVQTGKYHEWNIKEFGDPYSCFKHFNPNPWKMFSTKHIEEYIGFLPNKIVSVNKDKAEEFTTFLCDNGFKFLELKQYMFGQ